MLKLDYVCSWCGATKACGASECGYQVTRASNAQQGLGYDNLTIEAEVLELRQRVIDAELALNVWDKGHDSEYWLRHPAPQNGLTHIHGGRQDTNAKDTP